MRTTRAQQIKKKAIRQREILREESRQLSADLDCGGGPAGCLNMRRQCRSCLAQEADRLRAEVERLQQWVNDLQAGMYINCVYCGHRYGPDDEVPAAMAEVLKEHVEQCPEHPMSALRAQLAALRPVVEAAEVALDLFDDVRNSALQYPVDGTVVVRAESWLALVGQMAGLASAALDRARQEEQGGE